MQIIYCSRKSLQYFKPTKVITETDKNPTDALNWKDCERKKAEQQHK